MDMKEVAKFETKVGTLKLSGAVRECGYGNGLDYNDCVLGRAYRHKTGRNLSDDGFAHTPAIHRLSKYVDRAALEFGVDYDIAQRMEWHCFDRRSPDWIADWLESQGL